MGDHDCRSDPLRQCVLERHDLASQIGPTTTETQQLSGRYVNQNTVNNLYTIFLLQVLNNGPVLGSDAFGQAEIQPPHHRTGPFSHKVKFVHLAIQLNTISSYIGITHSVDQ